MRGFEKAIVWALFGAAVAAIGLGGYRMALDSRGIVIGSDEGAPWIAVAEPVTASIRQWRIDAVPRTRFATAFVTDPVPGPVKLTFRALGSATLRLNGEAVFEADAASRADRNWKQPVVLDVGDAVVAGRNELVIEIENARGPGLLSLRLEGRGAAVRSGAHWRGRVGQGPLGPVWLADDTRPHMSAHRAESSLAGLAGEAGTLLALFLAGAVGFGLWRRFAAADVGTDLVRLAGVFVLVGWGTLFLVSFAWLPVDVGFDSGSHLAYARVLSAERALPMATDGFSTYHPPLFYALAGATTSAAEFFGISPDIGRKIVPLLSGLGLAWLACAFARRLFPTEPGLAAASLLFAGFLPMNLVQAAYFGNEGLHAFLSAAAVFVAVDGLLRERLSVGNLALFSIVLGLALLTKFTAWLVAVAAGGALLLRALVGEPPKSGGRLAALAALVLPALFIAGWFYARNGVLYGSFLYGNWQFSGPGLDWWTQPGFHTPAYYLGFGASLSRPFLAGFESFWDAIYSTLWGDGFLGGQGGPGARHSGWNYALMAAVYPLALPATLLCAGGYGRGLLLAFRDPKAPRRAALGLLAVLCPATLFAIFWLTLELPYFGQAKAFYALFLTPVLGLYLGLGFTGIDRFLARRHLEAVRGLLYGWAAAFLGAIFLAISG